MIGIVINHSILQHGVSLTATWRPRSSCNIERNASLGALPAVKLNIERKTHA